MDATKTGKSHRRNHDARARLRAMVTVALQALEAENASLRASPLTAVPVDELPLVIRLRERIKYWKRQSMEQYVQGWNDCAGEGGGNAN